MYLIFLLSIIKQPQAKGRALYYQPPTEREEENGHT